MGVKDEGREAHSKCFEGSTERPMPSWLLHAGIVVVGCLIITGLVYWPGWRRAGAQTRDPPSSIIIGTQDVSDEQRREGNGDEKFTEYLQCWSVDPTPRNSSHKARNSFTEEKEGRRAWTRKEGMARSQRRVLIAMIHLQMTHFSE